MNSFFRELKQRKVYRFRFRPHRLFLALLLLAGNRLLFSPAFCHSVRLAQHWRTTRDINRFVVTFVVTQSVFRPISADFTYETRRGRESNPRIAVLQTATLPLGYPADLRERTISL